MEDMLRVGVITSTHGIKGEVKVFPTTDDPLRFKELKKCIIDGKREQVNVTVSSVKFFKQFVIVKFKEFDDINDIEKYTKCDLLVTREDAVKLEPGEYFEYTAYAPLKAKNAVFYGSCKVQEGGISKNIKVPTFSLSASQKSFGRVLN